MIRSHLGRHRPDEGAHDPASSHLASRRVSELCRGPVWGPVDVVWPPVQTGRPTASLRRTPPTRRLVPQGDCAKLMFPFLPPNFGN